MGKKGLGILTSLIIVSIIGSWLFFQEGSKFIGTSAYTAIPIHTPLILEVRDIQSFASELEENQMWKEFGLIPGGDLLASDVSFVDSLMNESKFARSIFGGKSLVVAFNFEGGRNCSQLNLISLEDVTEKSQIMTLMRTITSLEDLKLNRRKYEGSYIFDVEIQRPFKRNFSFAIHHGVFLFSTNKLLVEAGVRQLESKSILDDPDFYQVYKTVDEGSDISCFVNHNTFSQLFALPFDGVLADKFRKVNDYASWSELDLNIKNMSGVLSGFSHSNQNSPHTIDIFKEQNSAHFSTPSVLPSNTIFASLFHITDKEVYRKSKDEYLKRQNKYQIYQRKLNQLKKTYGIDPVKQFQHLWDGEFALAHSKVDGKSKKRFLIFKMKSRSLASAFLSELKAKKGNSKKFSLYSVDKETKFAINSLDFNEFTGLLLGDFYSGLSTEFYTFYDNYLIFSESSSALKELLRANVRGETLAKEKDFRSLVSNLSSKGVYMLYLKPSEVLPSFQDDLQPELVTRLAHVSSALQKFRALGWLITPESNMLYNIGYVEFDPDYKVKPKTVWKSHLSSEVVGKPSFVINHNDKQHKEVFVQDAENIVHLLNHQGRIVWSLPLNERIVGSVHQIDVYKNGKWQYLFNTKSKIHLLDRNGNSVDNYPIQLRAKATNPIAIFDYDKNKNYRFFVACDDHKLYAYDTKGRTVAGWNFGKSENVVRSPIQHYRIGTKDYIVFHDSYKAYILDRRGGVRVKSKGEFSFSNNPFVLVNSGNGKAAHLVLSSTSGDVYCLYFDGTTKTIDLPEVASGHFFRSDDLNNDGKFDFIFMSDDELTVVDDKGLSLISKTFDNDIEYPPFIYKFSKTNVKLGVVDKEGNEIHLINRNGTEYNGFPLVGSSPFSIGFMKGANSGFSLVVGGDKEFLYHYALK